MENKINGSIQLRERSINDAHHMGACYMCPQFMFIWARKSHDHQNDQKKKEKWERSIYMILTVRACYTTCPQFIGHHPPTHLLSRMGSIPLEGDMLISSSEQKQKNLIWPLNLILNRIFKTLMLILCETSNDLESSLKWIITWALPSWQGSMVNYLRWTVRQSDSIFGR